MQRTAAMKLRAVEEAANKTKKYQTRKKYGNKTA